MVVVTVEELGLERSWSDAELGLVERHKSTAIMGFLQESAVAADRRKNKAEISTVEEWEQHTAAFTKAKVRHRTYVSAQDEFAASPTALSTRSGGASPMADDHAMMRMRLEREEHAREAAVAAFARSDSNRSRIHKAFSESILDGDLSSADSTGQLPSEERDRRTDLVIRQLSAAVAAAEAGGGGAEACGLRLHRAIARAHCGQYAAAMVDVRQVLRVEPSNFAALGLRAKLVRHTSYRREQRESEHQVSRHRQTPIQQRGLSREALLRPHSPGLTYRPDSLAHGRHISLDPAAKSRSNTARKNARRSRRSASHGRGGAQHDPRHGLAPYGPAAEARALHAFLAKTSTSTGAHDGPHELATFRLRSVELRRDRPYPQFWRQAKPSVAVGWIGDGQEQEAEPQPRQPAVLDPSHWDYVIPRVADLLKDEPDKEALRAAILRALPLLLQTFEYYAHLSTTSPAVHNMSPYQRQKLAEDGAPGYGKVRPKLVHHKMAAMQAMTAAADIGLKATHADGGAEADGGVRAVRVANSLRSLSSIWRTTEDEEDGRGQGSSDSIGGGGGGSVSGARVASGRQQKRKQRKADRSVGALPSASSAAALSVDTSIDGGRHASRDGTGGGSGDDDEDDGDGNTGGANRSSPMPLSRLSGSSSAMICSASAFAAFAPAATAARPKVKAAGGPAGSWPFDRPDWLVTSRQVRLLAFDCQLLHHTRASQADLGRLLWFSSREVDTAAPLPGGEDAVDAELGEMLQEEEEEQPERDAHSHRSRRDLTKGKLRPLQQGGVAAQPLRRHNSRDSHYMSSTMSQDSEQTNDSEQAHTGGQHTGGQQQLSRIDVNNPHELGNEAHIYEYLEFLIRLACHLYRHRTAAAAATAKPPAGDGGGSLEKPRWRPPPKALELGMAELPPAVAAISTSEEHEEGGVHGAQTLPGSVRPKFAAASATTNHSTVATQNLFAIGCPLSNRSWDVFFAVAGVLRPVGNRASATALLLARGSAQVPVAAG
eukprot:SAG22_NODE_445_length_10447_cov_4.063104_5_plen_999_part_00